MADNFSVLTSNGTTTATFRATDNGAGILVMMSIPTNKSGTAMIGSAVMASSIPFTLATDQPPIGVSFATAATLFTVISTAGTPAATNIKTSAGTVWGVNFYNNATTVRFLKLYNMTAAGVSSAVAPKFTVGIPPGATSDCSFPIGAAFTTAISYLITGLVPDSDTTAVGIDDLHGIVQFG